MGAAIERLLGSPSSHSIDVLRTALEDDPWAVRERLESAPTQGTRSGSAAAFALLAEASGDRSAAATGWMLVRTEATRGRERDNELARLAGEVATSLGGDAAVDISDSLRAATAGRLFGLMTACDLAELLKRGHESYGGGRLGQLSFTGGAVRKTPLGWIGPVACLYHGPHIIGVRTAVLALGDQDPVVAATLASNGCGEALAQEREAQGRVRHSWRPGLGDRRLITTSVVTAPDIGSRVSAVAYGMRGDHSRAVLGTVSGEVFRWSLDGDEPGSPPVSLLRLGAGDRDVSISGVVDDHFAVAYGPGGLTFQRLMRAGAGSPWDPVTLGQIDVGGVRDVAALGAGAGAATILAGLRSDAVVTAWQLDLLPTDLFRSTSMELGSVLLLPATPGLEGKGHIVATRVGDAARAAVALDGSVQLCSPVGPAGQRIERRAISDIAPITTLVAGEVWDAAAIAGAVTEPDGATRVTVIAARTGVVLATFDLPAPVVDGDWSSFAGHSVLALVDRTGNVHVWDMESVRPLTSPLWPITDVAMARFAALANEPALLCATAQGAADVRTLRLADVGQVPDYTSDEVASAGTRPIGTVDPLGREDDAAAVAEIITSARLQPPLAIGLFGEWGEGKSYFMHRVRKHVTATSGPETRSSGVCGYVRQVQFNAWHYAEADLWASLVAAMFDQLAKPERTNQQVEQEGWTLLQAELVRESRVSERLRQVEKLQADIDRQLAERIELPDYDRLDPADRLALEALIGKERSQGLYEGVAASKHQVLRGWRGARAVMGAAVRRPWLVVTATAVLMLLFAVVLLVRAAKPLLSGVSLLTALGVGVALWAQVRPVAAAIRAAWLQLYAGVTGMLDAARNARADLEIQRGVASAEVAELRGEYDRMLAAGQLAGVLETRLKDGSYRSRLGLMSTIHADFSTLGSLLRTGGAKRSASAVGGRLPQVDRIALYIDDLDRCPPRRVVEVLEAVHLLLAVDLFVVVVAVDPRWLLNALTVHYADLLGSRAPVLDDSGDEELWRSSPINYLEKIFQVPFTLAPLRMDQYVGYINQLVRRETPTTPDALDAGPTADELSAAAVREATVPTDATPTPETELPPPTGPALPPPAPPATKGATPTVAIEPRTLLALECPAEVEQLDPLVLTDDEVGFLELLGPPLVTTPRSVKRLLNSYGLLLALQGPPRRPGIVGSGQADKPHRVILALLAIVIGAPHAAPTVFADLHAAAPSRTWTQFLSRMKERGGPFAELARDLSALTLKAATLDRALPTALRDWQPWVVPCGRLSFQTGRVVVRLDDHDDSPTTNN